MFSQPSDCRGQGSEDTGWNPRVLSHKGMGLLRVILQKGKHLNFLEEDLGLTTPHPPVAQHRFRIPDSPVLRPPWPLFKGPKANAASPKYQVDPKPIL